MNDWRIAKGIEHIDDDLVSGAIEYKRKRKKHGWAKWCAVAACLCLVVAFIAPKLLGEYGKEGPRPNVNPGATDAQHGNDDREAEQGKANTIVVNEVESAGSGKFDVQSTSYSPLDNEAWLPALEEFKEFVGVTYEELTDNVPKNFKLSDLRAISSRKDESLIEYWILYGTPEGGSAKVAINPNDKPLRDYSVDPDNPKNSEINGVPVVIHRYNDIFMAEFSYKNLNFDIDAGNITLEELETLLMGILG